MSITRSTSLKQWRCCHYRTQCSGSGNGWRSDEWRKFNSSGLDVPSSGSDRRKQGTTKTIMGIFGVLLITRSSADADKPTRRVYRSTKVTKHSIIPYVRYSFLLCNSNFVFKTRRFPIFDFKNVVTLKSGSEVTQRHWRWYHSIDCVWFPISVL